MKSIKVELPDKLARELNAMVKAGCFNDEAEAMRSALREFVRRNRLELLERFQREDITRALRQKGKAA
jgi:Arc/MetJ-type ribon-helix-helix transcriptional regulator